MMQYYSEKKNILEFILSYLFACHIVSFHCKEVIKPNKGQTEKGPRQEQQDFPVRLMKKKLEIILNVFSTLIRIHKECGIRDILFFFLY